MALIVGLGNPGPAYEGTRHNLGYLVVRRVARELGLPRFRRVRHGLTTSSGGGNASGNPALGPGTILLLPTTYMNRSGLAVASALGRRPAGLGPADLIVVHDDLDLACGRLKIRLGGTSGGHRGVASIIEVLGRDDFWRVKLGIGRPPSDLDPIDFVLARPSPDEAGLLEAAVERAAEAVLVLVREGPQEAMGRYNRAPAGAAVPDRPGEPDRPDESSRPDESGQAGEREPSRPAIL